MELHRSGQLRISSSGRGPGLRSTGDLDDAVGLHGAVVDVEGDLDVGVDHSARRAEGCQNRPTSHDACADAYAWVLLAFASGPWESGEVP